MNLPTELYIGREQTYIKHTFLRRYLETLAVKVLYGGWDAFNYVDGFAGPWEIRDEEGCSDASFGVAVDLLETVKEFVEMRRRGPRLKVRFYLCEKILTQLPACVPTRNVETTSKSMSLKEYLKTTLNRLPGSFLMALRSHL